MRHGEGDATRSRIVKKKAGEEGGSRWAIIQEKEGRGGVQRVTHCPKEGPGCGLSLLEQRVGRSLPGPTRYILPCPLQRFFFLSLSRSLPNANIVSENCTKARHVWSVNFCHHKSISHARGGGSFRRRGGQGAVHLETVTSNERNENPEILNICTQTYVSFDITLFANSDAFFSFLSLFEATKGTESLEPERPRSLLHQTRCHDFRGPIRGDFVVFLHQSFRLIGPRNLPPRQRELPKSSYSFPESGHQKEKRAHKRSSSLPLLDSVLRAEDRRDRQREEEGFLHLWRRRAPVVESLLILTRIARINPFLRRLKLGEGRGEEVTRMVKLYRSRCSISRPTVVPFSLSLSINSQILITTFFSLPLLRCRRCCSNDPSRIGCWPGIVRKIIYDLSKNGRKRDGNREARRFLEKSLVSPFSRKESIRIGFINFMKGKERERDRAYLCIILTRIALNRG